MSPSPSRTVERQPSRVATVVAAALAVAALLAIVGNRTTSAPEPPPLPAPTTRTTLPVPVLSGETADLVMAADGRLARVNLASGAVIDLPLGDRRGGIAQAPLTTFGTVVVVQRFVAWSIDPLGRRPPIELGPADAVVPADARFVWLVDLRRDVATRVSVDGDGIRNHIPLPPGTWRVMPITGRFVLSSQTRWLLLDADGRIVHEQEGRVLASGNDYVVWLPRPCRFGPCEVRVSDLRPNLDRSFFLEAVPSVSIHEAAVLGGFPELFLAGDLEGDRNAYEIVRVDLGATELEPELIASGLESPPLVMAQGDDTLFWTSRTIGDTTTLLSAFALDTGQTRTIELPLRDISTFSAF